MRLSAGVDAVEIRRIAAALERFGARFERRVFTPRELAFCRGRVPELAARFAAKEAVSKALGTGLRGIGWREVEILPNRRGKPQVYLYGRALSRAAELGLTHFEVSLTHTDELAIAFVVAYSNG
ncbi:MAG: holo-[acyl-carrier-protein] synthase [Chloroflexota bacterium]